jgi:two-component system, OmpR family, response regulator
MRVLVADDEQRIRAFVSQALEAEGFAVDAVEDGKRALSLARGRHHDLVLLDVGMPTPDGLAVLDELRRAGDEVPVILLGGRDDLTTKLRGFDLGADDYLHKPFVLEELMARVRARLRRAGPAENGHVLESGGLVLDLGRHRVRMNGVDVDLTQKEFRVLLALAENGGGVVSRERLLAEIWGYHFEPRSNVVEVCIRRLRRKLGPDAPIRNVRTAGYRLAD